MPDPNTVIDPTKFSDSSTKLAEPSHLDTESIGDQVLFHHTAASYDRIVTKGEDGEDVVEVGPPILSRVDLLGIITAVREDGYAVFVYPDGVHDVGLRTGVQIGVEPGQIRPR